MAIEPGTQVGADGERGPTGQTPLTHEVRTTPGRLTAVELSISQTHVNHRTDMLAGLGFKDGGDAVGSDGFIIPTSWHSIDITLVWGLFAPPAQAGPIAWGVSLGFTEFGGPLESAVFAGGALVDEADVEPGILNATVVVTDVVPTGNLLSATYGRCRGLVQGGSPAAEALDDQDTAELHAGAGGCFSLILTPRNITG